MPRMFEAKGGGRNRMSKRRVVGEVREGTRPLPRWGFVPKQITLGCGQISPPTGGSEM